jgi:hypothetical protein
VKRAALVLVAVSACLEPGTSLYERADVDAPQVLFDLMKPRILGGDAGVPIVQAGQTIELPFNEPMDPGSLRPGIVVRINPERNEIPLLIQAPPPGTVPYTVRIASAEGTYISGVYTMQLRTLLIDAAGNPINDGPELTGFFRVP